MLAVKLFLLSFLIVDPAYQSDRYSVVSLIRHPLSFYSLEKITWGAVVRPISLHALAEELDPRSP